MESIFKAGDKVCYKSFPDICIGSVSPDIQFMETFFWGEKKLKQIPIFTSGAWAEHFGSGVCPNTLYVDEEDLMIYAK